MTSAMDLPLHGKIKLFETSKKELLHIWQNVIAKHSIDIRENAKVESIIQKEDRFEVITLTGEKFESRNVLLAIGRRGTPRKLGVPGETLEKVAYRLLEPEDISGKNVVVVGGGDSAIETALLLADQNQVTLSYRGDVFNRLKPKNNEKITEAITNRRIDMRFRTNLLEITPEEVILSSEADGKQYRIKNDKVYIFAGGELPTQFLEKIGIKITKKFGEAILKH